MKTHHHTPQAHFLYQACMPLHYWKVSPQSPTPMISHLSKAECFRDKQNVSQIPSQNIDSPYDLLCDRPALSARSASIAELVSLPGPNGWALKRAWMRKLIPFRVDSAFIAT